AGFGQRAAEEAALDDSDLLAADVDEGAAEDEEQQEEHYEDGGDDEDDGHGVAFLGSRRRICDDANDSTRRVPSSMFGRLPGLRSGPRRRRSRKSACALSSAQERIWRSRPSCLTSATRSGTSRS